MYQHFVRQPLTLDSEYQRFQSINRVDCAISLVQSENKLVHVQGKMLFTERVVNAVKTPFQYRPDALYTVGVRHAVNEFLCRVIHSLVDILHFGNRIQSFLRGALRFDRLIKSSIVVKRFFGIRIKPLIRLMLIGTSLLQNGKGKS